MLGLSNASYKVPRLKLHYESDFTSDNDGWGAASVQGTLTQTFDEDIPGGSGGGWMKNVYDTNQTSTSGILRNNTLSSSYKPGDHVFFSYDIYLDGDWDGSDDVTINHLVGTGMVQASDVEVTQDTEENVYHVTGSSSFTFGGTIVRINFAEDGDYPQDGAIYYIKNIDVKVYNIV